MGVVVRGVVGVVIKLPRWRAGAMIGLHLHHRRHILRARDPLFYPSVLYSTREQAGVGLGSGKVTRACMAPTPSVWSPAPPSFDFVSCKR